MTRANSASRKSKVRREDLTPEQCLCDFCTGKCCRYFSLPIDRPETWDQFDAIRWYLAHGRTMVYCDKNQWYLLVMSQCNYLTADNRCGIYFNRPSVCQTYSTSDCEYDGDWLFEKIFESPEQLWEYAEAILPERPRPPAPALPVVTILARGENGDAPEHGNRPQAKTTSLTTKSRKRRVKG
jgi:Fe-S-cluster containining protein